MRNLKRVLSLGVTAAMISGLMIMGSSAASYADVSSEDNVEAVDVLQAVGVMVGDEDGNFNPDEYVTRNEMAVVMSNLLALNVSNFTSSSIPFADVPDWAAPYVAACYADGITSGTSDTTYGGDDTVTAAQAGLMMLKALGHFQYSSDFGSDWQLSAVRQASSTDLYDGVDAGASSAMTRNEVAQLALNALEATMVEPSSDGSTIVVGDITVSSNVSYDERTSSNNQYASISNDHADDSDSQYTIELGEELYDGDLEKSSADANEDVFGRPAVTWEYNNDEIGTYADDPEETYTAAVDKDALYDLIGSSVYNDLRDEETTLTVYVDGEEVEDVTLSSYIARNNDDDAEGTGRGVLTEVFVDDENNVTITQIHTYVAQVDGDYDEDNEELELTIPDENEVATPDVDLTLSSDDFDNLDQFSDEDYVLITVADDEVQTIEAAEVITATVSAYTVGSNVTADGTRYYYNVTYTDGRDSLEYDLGDDYTLVLDNYGYVVYSDSSEGVDDYVFITAMDETSGVRSDLEAEAYFVDGTNGVITIDSVGEDDADEYSVPAILNPDDEDTYTDYNGMWFLYDEKSNGDYELSSVDETTYYGEVTSSDDEGVITTNGRSTVQVNQEATEEPEVAAQSTVRANSSTIFVVNEDGDVTVYTGIRNVPDISVTGDNTAAVAVVMDDNYAEVVYIGGENLSISGESDDRVYVLDDDYDHSVDEDENDYYVYDAIVNGEVGTIEVNDVISGTDVVGLYEGVTYDENGYVDEDELDKVTVGSNASDDEDFWTEDFGNETANTGVVVDYSGGVLRFGDVYIELADSCTIFYNDDGDAETRSTGWLENEFEDGFIGTIYVYEDDDDQAVEIYVDGRNAANVTDDGDGETDAEATLAEYIDELNTSVTVSLSDVSYNSVLSAIEEEYSDSENNMSADAELTSSYIQPTEVGNTTRITADVTITYTYTDDNDEEAEVSDTISVTVTVVYVSNDTTATTEA